MNKFHRRIWRLQKAAYDYVSHADLCTVRDYASRKFDEVDLPTDFAEKFSEIESIHKELLKNGTPKLQARFSELAHSSTAIWLKSLLIDAGQMCDRCPNGLWIEKSNPYSYLFHVKAAKQYFSLKKAASTVLKKQ